jgi:predicted Zn-dependent protease
MKKVIYLLFTASLLAGCVLNAVTGRKQLSLINESELQLMAADQYQTFLSDSKVLNPRTNKDAAMVSRTGNNIADAIRKYYGSQGQSSILDGYIWEFNTIDSKEVNAWCMPGGKVVVYTGLLPVTKMKLPSLL